MLIPPRLVEQARANVRTQPWAAQARDRMVQAAAPWMKMSDDELWNLMFGPTLTRSWMVWSNGHCPACKKSVPMYSWEMDALVRPWKTRCPQCKELFPKNDFAAFYRSGLDNQNIFDPRKADRSFLFNAEHPDPKDPLHQFGVDDGEGYVEGDKRWRFVGAYLIYGQWKQAVLAGIRNLADAYVISGDTLYAHKAAILLDRVADVYPSFDHNTQAWVYETTRCNGYVSTWHDACQETRDMVLAYGRIREGLRDDATLAPFLSAKAHLVKLANAKASPAEICRNIEERILRDAIAHVGKIHANYPWTEIALAIIRLTLGTPADLKVAEAAIDDMVAQSTAVDGVTGEKGLVNYSAMVIENLAVFLAQMEQPHPGFLAEVIQRHPSLRQTYRFFIDTWCMQKFYPLVGDTGGFGKRVDYYAGASFSKNVGITPSIFTFFWQLYEATGDAAYVQILYHANGHSVEGLPYDLFASDPIAFQRKVAAVIARHGATPTLASVDKQSWHLAILRSGQGERARAAWMAYDTSGRHGHANGLNLGLFAYGLDLMPELGYPPVQFGGWASLRAEWYKMTAAHNTVVVDGANQPLNGLEPIAGHTTLWADGESFRGMRASAPKIAFPQHSIQPLSGPGHETIGFYLYREGRISRVKVFTKPEPEVGKPSPDWTLQFEDDFDRDELGSDWKVVEGQWRIEGGHLIGSGMIVCTRQFSGHQRLDYEATTQAKEPGDLSAFLAGNDTGFVTGAFFGFGSDDNSVAKLLVYRKNVAAAPAAIAPDQTYAIRCQCDGDHLQQLIDGKVVLGYTHNEAAVRKQYERTVAMVDLTETERPVPGDEAGSDFYLLDIFRVSGGTDHAKFMHSHFGTLRTEGLTLQPTPDYGVGTQMRNFRMDPAPKPGWTVDWTIEDRYGFHSPTSTPPEIHLRYTDLTPGAHAYTCEGWITVGSYDTQQEDWIPRILTRRKNTTGNRLASTFVAVIEPYCKTSGIVQIRRLILQNPDGKPFNDAHVAVEIELTSGGRHLLIAADVENPMELTPSLTQGDNLVQNDWQVQLDGEMALIRKVKSGQVTSITLCRASGIRIGNIEVKLKGHPELVEIQIDSGMARVVAGDKENVIDIRIEGKKLHDA